MSDLPITQLSGLQINNTGRYSRLSVPSMTTTQRDALIDITDGIVIYNIADAAFNFRQNGAWATLGGGGGGGVTSVAAGGALTTDQIGNRPVTGVGTISLAAKHPDPSGNFIAATITVDEYGLITDAFENINLVDGPEFSVDARIAIFDGDSGKLLKDSGVPIAPAIQHLQDNQTLNTTLYQISNLGALQFGNSTGSGVTGAILVDSLTPVTFHTQGVGINAQVCSVFNGEFGAGSSSPSALLEINSTTGGLLLSRLTTQEINKLATPVKGLTVYNTDIDEMVLYNGSSFVPVAGNSGVQSIIAGTNVTITGTPTNPIISAKDEGIIGPLTSTQNSLAVWDNKTGSLLKDSGNIIYNYGNPSFSSTTNFIGTFNNLTGKTIDKSNMQLLASSIDVVSRGSTMHGGTLSISRDQFYNIIISTDTGDIKKSPIIAISSLNSDASGPYVTTIKKSTNQTESFDFILPQSQAKEGQVLTAYANGETSWINNTTLTSLENSGLTVITDTENLTTLGLSFATINQTLNGEVVEFSKVVNINPTAPYMLNSNYGFLASDSSGVNQAGTVTGVSLVMTGSLVTSQVNTISSKHIKSILSNKKEDITEEVFELFKKINFVKYEYKDRLKHGAGIHYGVIAEEIKRDFPHLVQDMQENVPNIMRKGKVEYINSKTIKINFAMEEYWASNIVKGKKVTIFADNNTQIKDLIIESICSTDELILLAMNDLPKDLNQVFVYGTEENCPSVTKEKLFEMGLLVVQDLMNQVENLTTRINNLEQKLGA